MSNPDQQTLYRESYEHDACGIGAVVSIDGKASHAIVNDALAFGLPELHKRLFDKVQLDGEEKAVSVPKEYSVDAFYFELIRLMKEIIANQVVEKRLICSIFNLLSLWADGTRSGENFRKGFLKDTPDFIVKDEARLLKEAGR